AAEAGSPPGPAAPPARAAGPSAAMPLYFVENQGQVDGRVAYYVTGPSATLYFGADGLTFSLAAPRTGVPLPQGLAPPTAAARAAAAEAPHERWSVGLDFLGADPAAQPVGQDLTPARISYFKGPRSTWHAGLPAYAGVRYPAKWAGVDLVYTGAGGQ